MLDREMRQLFEEAEQTIQIEQEKRRESIAKLLQLADDKKENGCIDRKSVIINQIRYMDKSMLWVQLLAELLIAFIFLRFGSLEIPRYDMIAYTIIFSGMIGVLLPAAIQRSFATNIVELSETCYFNTKQMVVFQMTYSGISCLLLLLVGILFVGMKWQINFVEIGLYVLVPFVFSSCCCLGVLLTETGRRNMHTFVGVGLFLGVFYIVLVSLPYIYQASALLFWGIALIVGVCLFGIQLHILFRDIDKGEILCMN